MEQLDFLQNIVLQALFQMDDDGEVCIDSVQ